MLPDCFSACQAKTGKRLIIFRRGQMDSLVSTGLFSSCVFDSDWNTVKDLRCFVPERGSSIWRRGSSPGISSPETCQPRLANQTQQRCVGYTLYCFDAELRKKCVPVHDCAFGIHTFKVLVGRFGYVCIYLLLHTLIEGM